MKLSLDQTLAIENQITDQFGLKLELAEVLAHQIAVSRSALMTVFLTPDDKLYALVNVKNRAVLADIKKCLVWLVWCLSDLFRLGTSQIIFVRLVWNNFSRFIRVDA